MLFLAAAPDPRAAAPAFRRVGWPSFALLLVTGIWGVLVAPRGGTIDWALILFAKLFVVLLSAAGAVLQSRVSSRPTFVVGSVLAALGAVGALALGVVLGRT